jgi:hypothetical protein
VICHGYEGGMLRSVFAQRYPPILCENVAAAIEDAVAVGCVW